MAAICHECGKNFVENQKLYLHMAIHDKTEYTWLEPPRKYIPISRMSPNHAHSRASPGLNFSRNCTGPFTSFQ